MTKRFVSSEQNPDIKRIKALRDRRSVRHAERLCIVEGPRFVADAARIHAPLQIVVREELSECELPPADEVLVVPESLYARISDTATPQGMLAIFSFPAPASPTTTTPLLLIADGIQDPGNLGTLIRSAAALGATGVICTSGTVDPFAPKVIRAAAAAHWQILVQLVETRELFLGDDLLLIAEGEAPTHIEYVDLTGPVAIAVGGEGSGVSNALKEQPHALVSIPMSHPVESLNVGVAASILLYEAQRQRRSVPAC